MGDTVASFAQVGLSLIYDAALIGWLLLIVFSLSCLVGRLRGRAVARRDFFVPWWILLALYIAAPGLIARMFAVDVGDIGDSGFRVIDVRRNWPRDLTGVAMMAAVHLTGWLSTSDRRDDETNSPDR